MNNLHQWLEEAGEDVVQLSEIALSEDNQTLIEEILNLIESEPETQNAGTWILKHLVDGGVDLNSEQAERLSKACRKMEHWQSRVHILQLSSKSSTLTPATIVDWAQNFIVSENKFLKAWATYVSVIGLANIDLDSAQRILDLGLSSESGSVRARAKKAAEHLSKLKVV